MLYKEKILPFHFLLQPKFMFEKYVAFFVRNEK